VAAIAARRSTLTEVEPRAALRRGAALLLAVVFATVVAVGGFTALTKAPGLIAAARLQTTFFASAAAIALLAALLLGALALALDREAAGRPSPTA